MKVVDSKGQGISHLDQWRSRIFDGTSKIRHWKKGRSGYSLAEFTMDYRKGALYLEKRIPAQCGLSDENGTGYQAAPFGGPPTCIVGLRKGRGVSTDNCRKT